MKTFVINKDERIQIGNNIYLSIRRISKKGIEIGIVAPKNVSIHREEFLRALLKLQKNLIHFENVISQKNDEQKIAL